MSQSEEICLQLTVLQQPNDSKERQSPTLLSTASSTWGDANGRCGSRYSLGMLKSPKTYLYHHKQWMEVALLSIAIMVILMLLLLPTIFYHLPLTLSNATVTRATANRNKTSIDSSPGMCSNQIARTDAVCSSNVVYTHAACQDYLLTLQGCLPHRQSSGDVYVSATDQVETEGQVNELLNGLRNFIRPSPGCQSAVEPFLCLYFFGLCDSSGVAYEPSFEECVFISTDICASEWVQANNLLTLGGLSPLPECISFPSIATDISGSGSGRQNETSIQPLPTALVPENLNCSILQCQEGFSCSVFRNVSVCLPVCGLWAEYPHETVVAIDVVIVLSAVIGVVSSIAVLVISCIRWNRMFTFPSVFVVYMTITVMVVAVVVLITFTDRISLYCSSEHLIDTETMQLVGPTPFCTLTGIVFYYGLFQVAVWWFCHEISIFWGVCFPFHAKSFEKAHRTKYIHIIMVIVGLVLPALPVIVTFTSGDPSGFGLTRFPPILCTGLEKDATFYSLVLPINILMAIGIPLLIIIFRIIHKHHGLFRAKQPSNEKFKISTAERKILIVFCYYVLVVVIALIAFSATVRSGVQFADTLEDYWRCELTGVDPENPCDELLASLEGFSFPVLTSFAYILLGILPAVNLVFAVNISELKQKLKTWHSQNVKFSTPSAASAISAQCNT